MVVEASDEGELGVRVIIIWGVGTVVRWRVSILGSTHVVVRLCAFAVFTFGWQLRRGCGRFLGWTRGRRDFWRGACNCRVGSRHNVGTDNKG